MVVKSVDDETFTATPVAAGFTGDASQVEVRLRDRSWAVTSAPPPQQQQQQHQQKRQQKRQQQHQQQEEETSSPQQQRTQCERDPLCTRGYRHGGKGGRCSLPAEEPAAPDASDTDGPAEVEDVTAASSLRTAAAEGLELERSERAASGFKGVYQSGGRFTSSYTRDGARPFEPRGPPRLPLTLCSYPFSALSFVFAGETVYLGTFVTPEEAALSLARARVAHDADADEDDEGATHDPGGRPSEESSQCEKNPLCTRGESRVFNPLAPFACQYLAVGRPHQLRTGYKHGGCGGRCSLREANDDADDDDGDDDEDGETGDLEPAAALAAAQAEDLQLEQSERAATGFKSVYAQGDRFTGKPSINGASHTHTPCHQHPIHE